MPGKASPTRRAAGWAWACGRVGDDDHLLAEGEERLDGGGKQGAAVKVEQRLVGAQAAALAAGQNDAGEGYGHVRRLSSSWRRPPCPLPSLRLALALVTGGGAELLDALAQGAADIAQAADAKDDDHDHQHDEQFR